MLLEASRGLQGSCRTSSKTHSSTGQTGEDNHTAQIYQGEQDFRRFPVHLGVPPPQKLVPDDKFTIEHALEELPSSTTAEASTGHQNI